MSDAKSNYSETANKYTENAAGKQAYANSKGRESRYNANWKKQSVNLNEVVDKFAPGAKGKAINGKFIYFGDAYNVVADMPSGYVRVFDNKKKKYVTLEGVLGSRKETHYKIKRREEM